MYVHIFYLKNIFLHVLIQVSILLARKKLSLFLGYFSQYTYFVQYSYIEVKAYYKYVPS